MLELVRFRTVVFDGLDIFNHKKPSVPISPDTSDRTGEKSAVVGLSDDVGQELLDDLFYGND